MLQKGLIISKEYYTFTNGSVTCLGNIVDVLKKHHQVDVISANRWLSKDQVEFNTNNTIYRLTSRADYFISLRERILNSNIIPNNRKALWRKLSKPLFAPAYSIARERGFIFPKGWTEKACDETEKLVEISTYDYVLAIGAPFDNLEVAYKISKKHNLV